MTDLALPTTAASLFAKMQRDWHPSLLLDKYTAPPGEQSDGGQKEALAKILRAGQAKDMLEHALKHQKAALGTAATFDLKTDGPLTLHLSRANALENAGLAFHPVYGFVYLPGSGLKGMTRAWAEKMAKADEAEIKRVFGHQAGETGAAGTVVFHDALPSEWPELRLEIVTSHHRDYYSGSDKAAPGDWEQPNPVTFLAVAPGTTFRFALSPARGGDAASVDKAALWLKAALCHAGAGAKTAAGYGRFIVPNPPAVPQTLAQHEETLELVTPAFLAGAAQGKDDCDLTPGTLRGQLRWWWRTLHAKHVPLEELRRLEKLVWGGLSGFGGKDGRGSAVAVHLTRKTQNSPQQFDKRTEATNHNIRAPGGRTIMGLHYGAYGMDETDRAGQRKQRHYLPSKTSWHVQISARATEEIAAQDILTQALSALWLLCRYGGVGSKSRKGWGSFADFNFPGLPDLDACQKAAAAFRKSAKAESGSVEDAMSIEDVIMAECPLPNEADPWRALDRAGTLLQEFAKNLTPKEDRLVLGLPRLIGGKPGTPLKGPKGERHASPAHFHVARADSEFVLRLTAFPAAHLPDRQKSAEILKQLAEKMRGAEQASAAPTRGANPRAERPQAPPPVGAHLLPDIRTVWLYNGEKVRVIGQSPPDRVEIEDENGEYIDTILASSLQPLPR